MKRKLLSVIFAMYVFLPVSYGQNFSGMSKEQVTAEAQRILDNAFTVSHNFEL